MKKIHLEETGEEMTDEAAAGFVEAASEQTQELPNILNLGKDISGDVDEW